MTLTPGILLDLLRSALFLLSLLSQREEEVSLTLLGDSLAAAQRAPTRDTGRHSQSTWTQTCLKHVLDMSVM